MASQEIGRVKSGSGKYYKVYWNAASRDVYIGYAGRTGIGKATSANEAMNKAEAWLYNK